VFLSVKTAERSVILAKEKKKTKKTGNKEEKSSTFAVSYWLTGLAPVPPILLLFLL
jgi:hypothetical protein